MIPSKTARIYLDALSIRNALTIKDAFDRLTWKCLSKIENDLTVRDALTI